MIEQLCVRLGEPPRSPLGPKGGSFATEAYKAHEHHWLTRPRPAGNSNPTSVMTNSHDSAQPNAVLQWLETVGESRRPTTESSQMIGGECSIDQFCASCP